MVLDQVLGRELIPVLAPVCMGEDGATYNVNADTFAGAIAGALRAKRLLFLTDVPGVLDANKKLIAQSGTRSKQGERAEACRLGAPDDVSSARACRPPPARRRRH